jgi:hypothetical protein
VTLTKTGLFAVWTFGPLGVKHTKWSCEQNIMVIFLTLSLHFNLEMSHVVLFYVFLLSHVLPCFHILKLSSLHLVILRHPYITHMKSNFGNF